MFHADTLDALGHVGAEHLVQLVVPERFDLWVLEQAVLKDLFGSQFVAAVDQGHLGGKVRQEQRLFHSRVAAADHDDLLSAIEEPVACRAGRDAKALERLFRRKTQPLGAGSGRKDQSIRCVNGAAVGVRREGAFGQIQRGDQIADDLGSHGAGVRFHADHQVRTLHLGIAGPVLDFGGGGQLATRLHALNKDRFQHGAAGINTRRVAGRTGPDDQNFCMSCFGHGSLASQSTVVVWPLDICARGCLRKPMPQSHENNSITQMNGKIVARR